MPRHARRKSETGIYHVLARGINKQLIFQDNDDRQQYYMALAQAKENSDFRIYAYCLMDNHVHLLIHTGEESIGEAIRRIGSSYVYRYNKKHSRIGYLFQDRFKSEPVEDDQYLLTVIRYIHKNPLKAGIVESLGDYPWSSYKEYFSGKGIIDKEFVLGIFNEDTEKALARFKGFHSEEADDCCLDVETADRLTDEEAEEIILKVFNVESLSDIIEMNKKNRCDSLKELKRDYRISMRQLERLTGVNRGVIARIKV